MTKEQDSIGFAIIDTARWLRKAFDRRMKALGITRAQWSVVVHLIHKEGLTQSELAELMEIEQPSLVRHIDRLQEMGLLSRKTDASDRRIKRIFSTPSGRELLNNIEDECGKLRQEFTSSLNTQEEELLLGLLNKVKSNLITLSQDNKVRQNNNELVT